MRQADISEMTGIGKSSISTYLTGEYEPKQKNLYLIAEALEVNPSWLAGFDSQMQIKSNVVSFKEKKKEEEWHAPLVTSYEEASPDTQTAACAVLGIERIVPPSQEKSVYDEHEVEEIAAHNDEGDDEDLINALPDIFKALDEKEEKERVRNERLRKNDK